MMFNGNKVVHMIEMRDVFGTKKTYLSYMTINLEENKYIGRIPQEGVGITLLLVQESVGVLCKTHLVICVGGTP